MDEIDAKQQGQIERLEEHADRNRETDLWQWLSIIIFTAGLLLYLNFVFLGVLNNQSSIMKSLSDSCGSKK